MNADEVREVLDTIESRMDPLKLAAADIAHWGLTEHERAERLQAQLDRVQAEMPPLWNACNALPANPAAFQLHRALLKARDALAGPMESGDQ